jgi:predicted AAA+ superfamily ATPase
MKRLINKTLIDWKDQKRRKPLVIRGARQVGKTFSIEYFGRNHFENMVKIDFELDRTVHRVFEGDLHVNNLLMQLEAAYDQRIQPGKTLLFFDEIQECPRALLALRYFYEQLPDLCVVAAGSLLEFVLGDISFPVGRVQFEWLRPMGFEEFLIAAGHKRLVENLPDLSMKEPVPPMIHAKLLDQLHYYFFVGGMPEAVSAFIESGFLKEASRIHRDITQAYTQDFVKYKKNFDKDCIQRVFEQIPQSIGRRIKYTSLYPEKRIEKIKESVQILERALLIQKVHSSHAQGLPLGAEASPKVFKTIFLDIGLMQHMSGVSAFELLKKDNLLDVFRGALAEQFVGQQLLLSGGSENERLYYWDRPKKSSSAEIDYLLVRDNKIIPVEVKSGHPSRLKSMHIFLNEHPHCKQGLVMNEGNYRAEENLNLKFIPIYTQL